MSSPTSPFHISHATSHTDTTVYPPPNASDSAQYTTKKRKREGDSQNALPNGTGIDNDTSHAVYPNLIMANKHHMQLLEIVKKEAQQLAEYIVRTVANSLSLFSNA
jgi:proteasome activator subunit 3 (PA28 gamma)